MKIDFSKLEKIAEFRNGELQWLEGRDINAVYVILVGDEYYIGSSHYTYLRIGQHMGELEHGHHHSQKLQDKFNEIGEFEVYSLDRGIEKEKLKAVEFQYIKQYRPSLNTITFIKNGKRVSEPKDLKGRIRWLLKERGMTLNDLALVIGTTQTSISRMLGENGNPTYETLERIARALNVPIQELFANEHNTLICPRCGARFKLEE